MKYMTRWLLTLGLALSLVLATTENGFAARLGGGKSFGSRPSYSQPYQRSPTVTPSPTARPAEPMRQPSYSPAQQQNQAIRDGFRQRGGLGSLIGGLALGGLLGALFFGGAFEHINLVDFLLFGLIAYMLYRMYAARRQSQGSYGTTGYPGGAATGYERRGTAPGGADFDTDLMRPMGRGAATSRYSPIPKDFDESGFIKGAKAAYEAMQNAWDQGDLSMLRSLSTDKVFAELQDQFRVRAEGEHRTDLLRVEAEVLEVRDTGLNREVAVLFDVLMREHPETLTMQVREVWHFVRPRNSRQPTWFLDGIQQVGD